jgi:hypothetical protein
MRILRGFLKGAHLSRTTGSQIHPVRNATKSRACYGNDAPRAGKRHTACKVLAAPSELGNPHRTRVPTFPQQRLPRRTNLPKLQNPPKSLGLTDSGAELTKQPYFHQANLYDRQACVGLRPIIAGRNGWGEMDARFWHFHSCAGSI